MPTAAQTIYATKDGKPTLKETDTVLLVAGAPVSKEIASALNTTAKVEAAPAAKPATVSTKPETPAAGGK